MPSLRKLPSGRQTGKVGLSLIAIACYVFLPFIILHIPIFTVAGLIIFAVPVGYCFLGWITETPFPKPPGGGRLLFAGAFTHKEKRWNVAVDVIVLYQPFQRGAHLNAIEV